MNICDKKKTWKKIIKIESEKTCSLIIMVRVCIKRRVHGGELDDFRLRTLSIKNVMLDVSMV